MLGCKNLRGTKGTIQDVDVGAEKMNDSNKCVTNPFANQFPILDLNNIDGRSNWFVSGELINNNFLIGHLVILGYNTDAVQTNEWHIFFYPTTY